MTDWKECAKILVGIFWIGAGDKMDVQMEMILKGGQFKKLLEEQSLELRQK